MTVYTPDIIETAIGRGELDRGKEIWLPNLSEKKLQLPPFCSLGTTLRFADKSRRELIANIHGPLALTDRTVLLGLSGLLLDEKGNSYEGGRLEHILLKRMADFDEYPQYGTCAVGEVRFNNVLPDQTIRIYLPLRQVPLSRVPTLVTNIPVNSFSTN